MVLLSAGGRRYGLRRERRPARAQCHPPDSEDISTRGDIVKLPAPLKARLVDLANGPHTYPPIQAWDELSAALERTGMDSVEAARVMGGNMVRVARQSWHA